MVNRNGLAAFRNVDAIEIWALGLRKGTANTANILQSVNVLFAFVASEIPSDTITRRLAMPAQ